MSTFLLDRTTWDLLLDSSGNIAIATQPYCYLQDAASAARVFLGECYYDDSLGVPYLSEILGKHDTLSLLESSIETAAETIDGVESAICDIVQSSRTRKYVGAISLTLESGDTVSGIV